MRIKLTIAYDGTLYCGWQVQANATSIQTIVQGTIETILRHPIALTGAGRTDSGVHALGQTAHFDTDALIDLDRMRYSANALLPLDIRIVKIESAADDFHARYCAKGKIYHYHLHLDPIADPFSRLYRTPVYGSFDESALRQAAPYFIGTHDFASFANHASQGSIARSDTIRTLKRLDVIEQNGGLRLEFEGDGFLYKMVRNIVGTLLDVSAKKRLPEEMPILFEMKDRRKAGPAALPQGLFLIEVKYPSKNHLPESSRTIRNEARSLPLPFQAEDGGIRRSKPAGPASEPAPASRGCCLQSR